MGIAIFNLFTPAQLCNGTLLAEAFENGELGTRELELYKAGLEASGIPNTKLAEIQSGEDMAQWVRANGRFAKSAFPYIQTGFLGNNSLKPLQEVRQKSHRTSPDGRVHSASHEVTRRPLKLPPQWGERLLRVLEAVERLSNPDEQFRAKLIKAIKETMPDLKTKDRLSVAVAAATRLRIRLDAKGEKYSGEADLLSQIVVYLKKPEDKHVLSQTFREMLRNPIPTVKVAVFWAISNTLEHFDPKDQKSLLQAVEARLRDGDELVESTAIEILSDNTKNPLQTALTLIAMIGSSKRRVRLTAVHRIIHLAIEKLSSPECGSLVQALIVVSQNEKETEDARHAAKFILDGISPHLKAKPGVS